MKTLKISLLEIRNAIPPFPYISMTEEASRKWFCSKLKETGFDLDKLMKSYKDFESGSIIFEQEE